MDCAISAFALFSPAIAAGFGFRDGDTLLHFRVSLTDGTFLVLFSDGNSRVVDRLCGGLLAERDDISRFIGNIGHVDVDEFETYLFEFALHVAGNGVEEFVAIGIDLLDFHGSDDETELTEDNIFCKIGNILKGKAPKDVRRQFCWTAGSVEMPTVKIRAHRYGYSVWKARSSNRRVERGVRSEESIFLQEGKDETDAAVHALGASGRSVGAPAHLTVYDKDLVGRTGLDSGHDDEKQHHEDKHGDDDENDPDAPACRE